MKKRPVCKNCKHLEIIRDKNKKGTVTMYTVRCKKKDVILVQGIKKKDKYTAESILSGDTIAMECFEK